MDLQQDIQIVRAWSWARRPAPAFAGIRFFLAHASVDSRRGAIVQLSPEPAAQPSPVAVLGRWRRRDGSRTPPRAIRLNGCLSRERGGWAAEFFRRVRRRLAEGWSWFAR